MSEACSQVSVDTESEITRCKASIYSQGKSLEEALDIILPSIGGQILHTQCSNTISVARAALLVALTDSIVARIVLLVALVVDYRLRKVGLALAGKCLGH